MTIFTYITNNLYTGYISDNNQWRINVNSFKPTDSFYTDRSKAVPLLQFFFVCASVV